MSCRAHAASSQRPLLASSCAVPSAYAGGSLPRSRYLAASDGWVGPLAFARRDSSERVDHWSILALAVDEVKVAEDLGFPQGDAGDVRS
jgi:hypothetical protein